MADGKRTSQLVCELDGATSGIWSLFRIRSAFQPIFSIEGGQLTPAAFEGLARPFRGEQPVCPGSFFRMVPAGERSDVEALLRTVHILNAGAFLPRASTVFINFDPSLLTDGGAARQAVRETRLALHAAAIDPSRVVCEITEQRLSSASSLQYFLEAMREFGFQLAVDDFGAEDSYVERVRAVRPDIVKIDGAWADRLMQTGQGFVLLAALLQDFAGRGIRTVIEGIETGRQLELAERAGASLVQGFGLRRPELVPADFSALLREHAPAQPRKAG